MIILHESIKNIFTNLWKPNTFKNDWNKMSAAIPYSLFFETQCDWNVTPGVTYNNMCCLKQYLFFESALYISGQPRLSISYVPLKQQALSLSLDVCRPFVIAISSPSSWFAASPLQGRAAEKSHFQYEPVRKTSSPCCLISRVPVKHAFFNHVKNDFSFFSPQNLMMLHSFESSRRDDSNEW